MIRKGFTLIELIFVIVIVSIISMFGASLYTKIYRSYDNAKLTYMLQSRTAAAADMISARLSARIKDAIIGRRGTDNTFVSLDSVTENHDILEWLGQAVESRDVVVKDKANEDKANSVGWSGYIDLDNPLTGVDESCKSNPDNCTTGTLVSPASHIPQSLQIINQVRNSTTNNAFGIVYKSSVVRDIQTGFGFDGNTATNVAIGGADGSSPDRIHISNSNDSTQISNQYYQVFSAYSIVPINRRTYRVKTSVDPNGREYDVFDLALFYNYEPYNGQIYSDNSSMRSIIARNVTLFRFKDDNGGVAFKICMRRDDADVEEDQTDYIVCKSQVVF